MSRRMPTVLAENLDTHGGALLSCCGAGAVVQRKYRQDYLTVCSIGNAADPAADLCHVSYSAIPRTCDVRHSASCGTPSRSNEGNNKMPAARRSDEDHHYAAREPDAQGHIHYPDAEHAVWQTLVERQLKLLDGRARREYLDGLDQLALPHERIPQLGEINRVLAATTGWQVERVPALIPFNAFSNCWRASVFPSRPLSTPEELDYCRSRTSFTRSSVTARC